MSQANREEEASLRTPVKVVMVVLILAAVWLVATFAAERLGLSDLML